MSDRLPSIAIRRIPVIYSAEEVAEIMWRLMLTNEMLADRLSVSTRTVRRMLEKGATGPKAAALNAFLRVRHYGLNPTLAQSPS